MVSYGWDQITSTGCELRPSTTLFGRLLRSHRQSRRMSMTKLAALSDIDHSYVSRIESGGRIPHPKTIRKLSDALDLSADEFNALFFAANRVDIGNQAGPNAARVAMAIFRLTPESDIDSATADLLIDVISRIVSALPLNTYQAD